jgi:hypothetical protein
VGPGLQAITQHGLQAFLWHELPRKWLTDQRQAAHRRFAGTVAGAGRAGPLHGDLPWAPDRRGAAAYEGGGREGFWECRRAQERSGVELPDLPGPRLWFALGPVMGEQEAGAFVSVAAALELAVAGGKLRPGARGWRAAQQAVARRHLAAAGPKLDGRSWLVVVAAAERLSAWARSRGEARRALVDPVLSRLAGRPLLPVPVPPGWEEALAPLRWLLTRLARGGALR